MVTTIMTYITSGGRIPQLPSSTPSLLHGLSTSPVYSGQITYIFTSVTASHFLFPHNALLHLSTDLQLPNNESMETSQISTLDKAGNPDIEGERMLTEMEQLPH